MLKRARRREFPRSHPDDGEPHRLLTFLALHAALGVALGIAFASLVVLTNVAGIKDLLTDSSEPFIPMILFFASCALTIGSVTMGIAVMSLPLEEPDDNEDSGGEGDSSADGRPDPGPRADGSSSDRQV
ncbi:MAG: hypothetical protein AB7E80_12795 [Hyphomicrobiaceae bacterium]